MFYFLAIMSWEQLMFILVIGGQKYPAVFITNEQFMTFIGQYS